MLFYGVAAGCEALAGAGGWNELLYRTWYLTGAVWTAGWLGLGTAFLLGRTRFGYPSRCASSSPACSRFLTATARLRGAGMAPLLYFIAAGVLALAVAVETYFQNDRWPIDRGGRGRGATLAERRPDGDHAAARPGYALDPSTGIPSRPSSRPSFAF